MAYFRIFLPAKGIKIGINFELLYLGFLPYLHDFHHAIDFVFSVIQINVSIGVEGDANIRVSHQILQRLRIHSGISHVGTISVPANMRRYQRHLHLIDTVVLLSNMLEVVLPVQGIHNASVFIKI